MLFQRTISHVKLYCFHGIPTILFATSNSFMCRADKWSRHLRRLAAPRVEFMLSDAAFFSHAASRLSIMGILCHGYTVKKTQQASPD